MKLVTVCSIAIACGPSTKPPEPTTPAPAAPEASKPIANRAQHAPKLAGPAPEVRPVANVALPTMPSFQLPPTEAGLHSPLELLVAGRKLLGTEVKVKGYVTWVYDCLTDVGKPGEKVAAVQRRIDADPTLCERPKLYLGTDKTTPPERSLWVVDVPRKPNKLERERLPKDELAKWPAVPRLAVGDLVVVTGELALQSPHAERNSDGLIVYRGLEPGKPTPAGAAAAPPPPPRPALAPPPIAKQAPVRTDPAHQTTSVVHSNTAARAYMQKQLETAIAEYQQAVAEWPDNHIAWYGLAGAHAGTKAWRPARDAVAHAVAIDPDQPMYHLIHGVAEYEAAVQQAREDQAAAEGKSPDDVTIDRSKLALDGALASLGHALRLQPDLWRAHYYVGRIYRDRGEARWAAEELEAALRFAPPEPGPWIALAELYRAWRYAPAAIVVAQQAIAVQPQGADLHYELGMALDDAHKDAEAIESFTRAITLRPDHAKAKFQRAQTYFRGGDAAKAKQDLDDFLAAPGGDQFARQQAHKMLLDLAAKKR